LRRSRVARAARTVEDAPRGRHPAPA
jgi:hypothetical protein